MNDIAKFYSLPDSDPLVRGDAERRAEASIAALEELALGPVEKAAASALPAGIEAVVQRLESNVAAVADAIEAGTREKIADLDAWADAHAKREAEASRGPRREQ